MCLCKCCYAGMQVFLHVTVNFMADTVCMLFLDMSLFLLYRPNQLFRECVPDSDAHAKRKLYLWQTTRSFQHHLTPAMGLKDITQCLPKMWKVMIHWCGHRMSHLFISPNVNIYHLTSDCGTKPRLP